MLGKREGLVLGKQDYGTQCGIDAVAQREINNAVITGKGYRRFGSLSR